MQFWYAQCFLFRDVAKASPIVFWHGENPKTILALLSVLQAPEANVGRPRRYVVNDRLLEALGDSTLVEYVSEQKTFLGAEPASYKKKTAILTLSSPYGFSLS